MRTLALCAGIGGLERGLALAGVNAERTLYVESDPYACAVLAARVASGDLGEGEILRADLRELRGLEGFDLVTAGFPCQPASAAGKRLGRADERWIWPHIARIIAELRPRAVFLENVRGLLTVDGGAGFREVLERLAACGFDARWGVFRASDVGAPHRRERVFILARIPDAECFELRDESGRFDGACRNDPAELGHLGESPLDDAGRAERRPRGEVRSVSDWDDAGREQAPGGSRESGSRGDDLGDPYGSRENARRASGGPRRAVSESGRGMADADRGRCELERVGGLLDGERPTRRGDVDGRGDRSAWPPGPQDVDGWRAYLAAGGPAPAVGGRLNPDFVEALMGFPTGWTHLGCGNAARRDRLRCLGNAVVPAQAALAWGAL